MEAEASGGGSSSGISRIVRSALVMLEQPKKLVLGAFVGSGGDQAWEYWEGEFGPSELAAHVRAASMLLLFVHSRMLANTSESTGGTGWKHGVGLRDRLRVIHCSIWSTLLMHLVSRCTQTKPATSEYLRAVTDLVCKKCFPTAPVCERPHFGATLSWEGERAPHIVFFQDFCVLETRSNSDVDE